VGLLCFIRLSVITLKNQVCFSNDLLHQRERDVYIFLFILLQILQQLCLKYVLLNQKAIHFDIMKLYSFFFKQIAKGGNEKHSDTWKMIHWLCRSPISFCHNIYLNHSQLHCIIKKFFAFSPEQLVVDDSQQVA